VFDTRESSTGRSPRSKSRGQVHQATRHAIAAAHDVETCADLKSAVGQRHKIAEEWLADLDRAFSGRGLSGVLHAEQRRTVSHREKDPSREPNGNG
jgi:hypothetical protein